MRGWVFEKQEVFATQDSNQTWGVRLTCSFLAGISALTEERNGGGLGAIFVART